MAALIRLADETDAEFARRTRPVAEALMAPGLYQREIKRLLDSNKWWSDLLKVSALRRSCGVQPSTADTVKLEWKDA